MSQVDIARVALGAPALQQVLVISRPECLLIKAWARNEQGNTEDAAALIGKLFGDSSDALTSVGGGREPRTLMVESSDRVVVVSRVAEDMSAAFIFEQSAPLGLVRVQARQLTAQLARTLSTAPSNRPPSSGRPAPAHPNSGAVPRTSSTIQPQGVRRDGATPAPADRRTAASVPGPVDRRASAPAERRTSAQMPRPAERRTSAQMPRPAERQPTSVHVRTHQASRAPSPAEDLRAPAPHHPPLSGRTQPLGASPPPTDRPAPHLDDGIERDLATRTDAASGRFDQLAARIEAFTQTAPDARSALLRLSLRTGLPMELLDRSSALSPAQAELIARALDELQHK